MITAADETSQKIEFDAQRTLRDIAVRLATVAEFAGPRDIATRELLTLLREGKITAFAHTPSEIIPKVPISPIYWRSIVASRKSSMFPTIGTEKEHFS